MPHFPNGATVVLVPVQSTEPLADGSWPGLARTYGLAVRPVGIEHGLAYQAIRENKLDVTDVYITDGDIKKFDLFLLEDDKQYFPQYLAVPLVRTELDVRIKQILGGLR